MAAPTWRARLAGGLFFAAVGVAALWVFATAQADLRADFSTAGARQLVELWASGRQASYIPQAWQAARADLEAVIAIQPYNPTLQDALGDLYLVAARLPDVTPELQRQHLQKAQAQYRKSLELRPHYAYTWAALANALAFGGERGAPMHQAWEKGLALGPNEGYVQPMLLHVALYTWPEASPRMKQWAADLFENSSQGQRDEINRMAAEFGLEFKPDAPPKH